MSVHDALLGLDLGPLLGDVSSGFRNLEPLDAYFIVAREVNSRYGERPLDGAAALKGLSEHNNCIKKAVADREEASGRVY